MKNAGDHNALRALPVKDNVAAASHSTKAGSNILTRPARGGIVGKHLATRLKIIDIPDGLVFAPGAKSIRADAEQVGFGTDRETKSGHWLVLRRRQSECFPDARKCVAFWNTARVSVINGRA
jgi:hypothetical protein